MKEVILGLASYLILAGQVSYKIEVSKQFGSCQLGSEILLTAAAKLIRILFRTNSPTNKLLVGNQTWRNFTTI